MKNTEATTLVERYFAGETTVAEERALATYFAGNEVAENLQQYAPLFGYWQQQRSIAAPKKKLRPRRLSRTLLAVAAALLLLLVANVVHRSQRPAITAFPVAERQPVDWSQYEITDEREALEFVKTVLSKTSGEMKRGAVITVRELRGVEEILD